MCVQSLSHVQLSAIPWTVARQALRPWDSLGKNTGGGCHFLLQGVFPTQGSNLGLLYCKRILYHLSHLRNPHSSIDAPNAPCSVALREYGYTHLG